MAMSLLILECLFRRNKPPDRVETIRITFDSGVPVKLNGEELCPHEMVLSSMKLVDATGLVE